MIQTSFAFTISERLAHNLYKKFLRHVHGYCLLFFLLWNIHTSGQYPNCEKINAFIINLHCATFIYCATLARAINFWEAFLHNEVTCSSKSNLLLNNIRSSFSLELLVMVSFLIFNAKFSSVFISRWHLSGLAFKKSENQWKSLSIFFQVIQLLYQVQDHRRMESCHLHNLQDLYRYHHRANHK